VDGYRLVSSGIPSFRRIPVDLPTARREQSLSVLAVRCPADGYESTARLDRGGRGSKGLRMKRARANRSQGEADDQATGRDARGRKQYRYHPKWREVRDQNKYDRMLAFGQALPAILRRLDRDLRRPGLAREKVLATVVRLLETTVIRVG
jgi:hypothetical protein